MGIYIIFSKFVGVISGNKKMIVGYGKLCDYLIEMLFFVQVWGKNFVIVFIFDRYVGDNFWFVVSKDNIYVSVSGVIDGKLFIDNFVIQYVGGYVQKYYSFKLYFYVILDKLMVVYQFLVIQILYMDQVDFSFIMILFIE